MDGQELRDAIEAKTDAVYMSSYEELKDYYQDKHGARHWIGAFAQALSGSPTRSRGDKAYSRARRTIERHESGQYKKFGKDVAQKFEQIGKSLPPVRREIPGGKLELTLRAKQGNRERSWTVTFSGSDAYSFMENPSYRAFFEAANYPDYVIDMFEDGDYMLSEEAVS
jgi:hypothetical protein